MNRTQFFPQVPLAQPTSPSHRKLRTYSVDPSLALRVDSLEIAVRTACLPWEELRPGPIGEYLEVIDVDPSIQGLYLPADLDEAYPLSQEGFEPSISDPRFHQQMVYAVAMSTIVNFERSWGRYVQWAPRTVDPENPFAETYLQRLRIYPHGMRSENAFYDPATGSIIFGYFRARETGTNAIMPRSLVFTCLSADVIAHEMTHAILDGIHPRFIEDSNLDVLAFHEAFADAIALLQHFSDINLLSDQIAKTRGDLDTENQMAKLASEFGQGTSGYGALRDAIGQYDVEGRWRRRKADPRALESALEPHARGAILVSAIFEGYLTMYRARTRDLIRIATSGTGVVPLGEIHPDLVRRLANEAVKAAQHLTSMLVRAIDYCPPFDITFGEYLRAVISADIDVIGAKEDQYGYRQAIASAFAAWGIYASGVISMDQEELRWKGLEGLIPSGAPALDQILARHIHGRVNHLRNALSRFADREQLVLAARASAVPDQIEHTIVSSALGYAARGEGGLRRSKNLWTNVPVKRRKEVEEKLRSMSNRELEFHILRWFRRVIHGDISRALNEMKGQENTQLVAGTLGLALGRPFEVHAARLSQRVSPTTLRDSGTLVFLELTQQTYLDGRTLVDLGPRPMAENAFLFRGGCTLVLNVTTAKVQCAIRKRFESTDRRTKQRDYLAKRGGLAAVYFDESKSPFSFIHSELN